MSERLLGSLLPVSVNLVGMMAIFSLMAYALVRLHWHRKGVLAVVITIVMAQLFCILPYRIAVTNAYWLSAPIVFCFANGLASAFAIVILRQAVKWIPRQLEDSARLDGCRWLGIYWHVLLPIVRKELVMIGLLTVMTTAYSISEIGQRFLVPSLFSEPGIPDSAVTIPWALYHYGYIGMVVMSLSMSLPVIAIFLMAKHYLGVPTTQGGEVASK